MEKLFEKILHEMRSRISFLLAFVVSLIVFIVNPKGVFHFIFESIFQYTQNKILSFSLSFFFIFFFFYANFFIVGKIINKVLLWYRAKNEAKKYEQYLIDQKDKEIALKIHECHYKIQKELYIGLRDFFEPTKDDYIVKPYVLRAIKKYHEIAFKSIYWQQNK
ncbi:hypothetical protein [Helicobacter pylori]|uniref:hypothetical protein n=1 Tax=Helicobacter pylori TaxID=210 RepID=UPI0018D1F337|nr:hypothetical protein [Helicobacter pylori]MBH0279210.1 hypothetical protein [Helicobacter pylori]MBH0301510.1 hypothetical protein [Helicobacter pylori]